MNSVLKVLVLVIAVSSLVTGLRLLVDPSGIAPQFGLTLDQGVGLSSQVGDMSAFFLTLATCLLIALISGRRSWYYPAIMLLSFTAIGRTIAWLVHDAALALDLIAPEVVVSIILLVASRRLAKEA